MGQKLPALWCSLNELRVNFSGNADAGKGPVCCDDTVQLARLALRDKLLSVLSLRCDDFGHLRQLLPFVFGTVVESANLEAWQI